MLLQVIQELMQHSIPNIQRKAMELLNNFLQQKEHTMVCSKGGINDPIRDQDAWPFGWFHLAMFINLTLLNTCTCKLILLHNVSLKSPLPKKFKQPPLFHCMHMYNIWLLSVCYYFTLRRIIFQCLFWVVQIVYYYTVVVFFLKETSLLGVVDKLLRVCSAENTEVTTVQTALYSLKLLCRRIGPNHPQMFIKVGVHSISFLKEKILFKNFHSHFSFCIHVHDLMSVVHVRPQKLVYCTLKIAAFLWSLQ